MKIHIDVTTIGRGMAMLSFLLLFQAGWTQTSFESGISELENGNPAAAISHFTELVQEGQESLELYANLARGFYEEGDLAKAILYYERASRLEPSNKEISQTLETLRREVDIRISDIPDFIVVSAYRSLVTSISASFWAILQIVIAIIFCFLLYKVLLDGKGSDRRYVRGTILVGLLSILCLIFSFSAKNYRLADDAGIVMSESTSILLAPDDLSKSVTLLSAGNKVFIIEELGEWYKVRLRDRDEGWIKKEEVTII